MQNDRVVMTASQLHFFSQRILGPTAISECDVSHIHYAKIVTAIVVNSYSCFVRRTHARSSRFVGAVRGAIAHRNVP
jgi:hypothetical protein